MESLATIAMPSRHRVIGPWGTPQFAFDPAAAAVARVHPGATVVVETADCFGGRLWCEGQVPAEELAAWPLNPVTGPIWIDGAEPGDALVVRIAGMEATRDWAVSCLLPGCGLLADPPTVPGAWADAAARVWLYHRTQGGFARQDSPEIPWAPFFGTIGVAPAMLAVATEHPGPHGGNLDVPIVGPGAALVLPVFQPGALFSVGDAHAAQGQGEVGGPALEISARGTLSFALIKGAAPPTPLVETADAIAAIGIGRPMDEAVRAAFEALVERLARAHGLVPVEAVQLLTLVGGLTLASMVNSAHTVVASCPKRFLPAPDGGWLVERPPGTRPSSNGKAPHRSYPLGDRPWHLT